MPPRGRSAQAQDSAHLHEARVAGLKLVTPGGLTIKAFAARFQMTYAQARYIVLN